MPSLASFVLVAAAAQTGCAAIAGVVPPSRTEVGSTVIADGNNPTTGFRFATGAHLASGQTRRNAKWDVGAGYVFERLGAPPAAEMDAPAYHDSGADSSDHIDAHGGYVDVAHALESSHSHRSWLGMRGETLVQSAPDGRRLVNGAYARFAWELYGTGQGAGATSDNKGMGVGFAYGSWALGLYAESGYRFVEHEQPAFVAMGGLSLRLPVFGGFAVGFK